MKVIQKSLWLTGIIVLPFSIYTAPVQSGETDKLPAITTQYIGSKSENINSQLKQKVTNTLTATIYQVDSQCQNLVAQKITVPSKQTVEAVVGRIITNSNNSDFSVVGYRININSKTGIATIDLRLPPNAKRKFSSLSPCEIFTFLGSIRKTLMSNPTWKIKDVRFTEKNQEIFI